MSQAKSDTRASFKDAAEDIESATTAGQLPQSARLPASATTSHSEAQLCVDFTDDNAATNYVLMTASLFSGIAEELLVFDVAGQLRDDLDVHELGQRLRARRVASLRFHVPLGRVVARITLALRSPSSVVWSLPVAGTEQPPQLLWLQADVAHLGPVPTLVLPVVDGALAEDALHALVAVGVRVGSFASAQLTLAATSKPSRSWCPSNPPPGAQPIVGLRCDTLWRVATQQTDVKAAVAWCTSSAQQPEPLSPSREWWVRLRELAKPPYALDALEEHLRTAGLTLPAWKLVDYAHAQPPHFMVPPEHGTAVALLPVEDHVLVGVDVSQPGELVEPALLHALSHLALGHVRPGDRWGHWDTAATVTSKRPHRVWDQDAKAYATRTLASPLARRVDSLEQCTSTEKAQLGLWRMIGEMLGESRRLHPAAERYQKAAYQRQAAQRLISMLEDFGGAMLCDGVGLGKTYVATTLMVHYANLWREQLESAPDRSVDDPFRITIIAPHSVVSTWRREALPGLAAAGVPLASVRVISHTQFSRMSSSSGLLERVRGKPSDLEHLLLSDFVIVDEAHNFRSLAARRTKVLRDLLRVQPRREIRRRVVLLTATPINNSLDDLRQEVSLLFSRPLGGLSDAKTDEGYRRQTIKEVEDRCTKARAAKVRTDIAALVIHGQPDARFTDSIEFRDDLDFGPNVQRIGDYLKEQDKRLKELQERIRTTAQSGQPQHGQPSVRIAEDLLDRIVVQRSRGLCKEIERQQSSSVELLFRPDAGPPERLRYSDEYDGITDVLARFLPLFATGEETPDRTERALSLKVYMWYDVRQGLKSAAEISSVIGLQRVLVLKRLESSPVSFLITLLRLAVLHAHRLQQLGNICLAAGDPSRQKELKADLDALLARQDVTALAKIRSLSAGDVATDPRVGFIKSLSAAYAEARPAADTDDPPPQLSLLIDEEESSMKREELDRLWMLREAIFQDFETLLLVTPELADIVFGKFEQSEWPHRFIAGGESIDWPTSAAWGLRLVTDAKIQKLVARLVAARRSHQKVVVFSQFSDTVAYIQSVLRACNNFSRQDWQVVVRGGLGITDLKSDELTGLLAATATITGQTEERDEVVNAFAPFYRIGPFRPAPSETGDDERWLQGDAWEASWTGALVRPIDILLSTDVLAEGVNLQDAALIINFDVHWNPVRMIQRAGRIDRRLNPRIEHGREFPELVTLATRVQAKIPRYYWHEHPTEPPITVNMILPDELEAELLLRERIATKTLAIDFTLGLEQGTGAEADWMASYKYQGITSLNSMQKDRAIEQIAGHHERLARLLTTRGVRTEWAENLNGWFRSQAATEASPLVGRARLGRRGGVLERFSRYLEPSVSSGMPFWCWAEKRPGESMFDGWLMLDGRPENFPPRPRRDLPFHDNAATPVRASHLLGAAEYLAGNLPVEALPMKNIGRPLMQGASALAAPKLGTEEDRRMIAVHDFYFLQLSTFEPGQPSGDAELRSSITTSSAPSHASDGVPHAEQ